MADTSPQSSSVPIRSELDGRTKPIPKGHPATIADRVKENLADDEVDDILQMENVYSPITIRSQLIENMDDELASVPVTHDDAQSEVFSDRREAENGTPRTPGEQRESAREEVGDADENHVEDAPDEAAAEKSPRVDDDEDLESEDDDTNDEEETDEEEESDDAATEDELEERFSDEEEASDHEDEEPKLKYQRLGGTLSETLKKDAVSAMAVSDRFLALGTHWGAVHILDIMGTDVKRFQSHSATVTSLSIDTGGEYVASASVDGKVVISSLYSQEVQKFNYQRPVKAVALEPDYSRKNTRQFISGGMAEYLLQSGKGWFGNKDIVISSGEGPIYNVKWRATFVAWANEAGIKIYDIASQQKFAYIDRPPNSPRADLFRCNLVWKSDVELLIGWADNVKLCVIKERSKMDVASGLPSKYVEIVCQFRTDFVVSGLAPLGDDIVLLSFMTNLAELRNVDVLEQNATKRSKAQPPEIRVVDSQGATIANDVLSLLGFEHYQANDYQLEYLPGTNPSEATFYVVSPKDIVVAKPRDVSDHIEWLVDRKRYEEALRIAEAAGPNYEGRLQVNSILDIGQKYMATLMGEGRYDEVAATCPKILRTDKALWEEWVAKFDVAGQLRKLFPYLPVQNPQLENTTYKLVLTQLLKVDVKMFLETIRSWPSDIYDASALVHEVENAMETEGPAVRYLQEAAKELHMYARRFDRALFYGLLLRDADVLDLVKEYNLYSFVQSHAVLIMEYDDYCLNSSPEIANEIAMAIAGNGDTELRDIGEDIELGKTRAATRMPGVQLLISHPDHILATQVAGHLTPHRKFLHIFLDALFKLDAQASAQFHHLQISLYADFDPPRLIDFLRLSPAYSVQTAYSICQKRDLVPEMVFLLGKMGDNRTALNLIISRLGDVKRAIEFAKEQNDDELWEDLLKYSMDKPSFIVGLLENLGGYINPIRAVERIPEGLEIPGLKKALIKIMNDIGIQMELREGCEKILISDTAELLDTLYRAQRRGMLLDPDVTCATCHTGFDYADDTTLVTFFCTHVYHLQCITSSVAASAINSPTIDASFTTSQQRRADKAVRLIYHRPSLSTTGLASNIQSEQVTHSVREVAEVAIRFKKRDGLYCPLCRSNKDKSTARDGGLARKRRGKRIG
ncbi:Vacuolar protein sorting-associated protein 41 [Gaertneriomyces sp. JEL0708]|nr:Vacuolar protein sorting-associated protein 41 [Gaertneriomyces sp. JEL0708]